MRSIDVLASARSAGRYHRACKDDRDPRASWLYTTLAGALNAGRSIVITGSFNNTKNLVATFAKDADVLPATRYQKILAVFCETCTPDLAVGRVADQADARMMILGHRSARTRGRESLSRNAIEENYDGTILFANDGECWGL